MLQSNSTQGTATNLIDVLELEKGVVCDIHNYDCLVRKCLNCSPDTIKNFDQGLGSCAYKVWRAGEHPTIIKRC